jgi:hypothetical protein
LDADEEEVEDIRALEKIEEIMCATYERNTRGVVSNGVDPHV